MTLKQFTESIPNFFDFRPSEKIEYFLYYIFSKNGTPVTAKEIEGCYDDLHINPYSNVSAFLRTKSKGKGQKFLKRKEGYLLHKKLFDSIDQIISKSKPKAKTSTSLRELLTKISNSEQNEFLDETIKCFEIGAYRASIIMTWNLAVDHLFKFILSKKLTQFNPVVSANTDRRVKIKSVSIIDDFSEIPEGKFIEFCRSSKIISNDVRKILEVKLGIRNTCAHPSNVKILESKAIEVIEDLTNNVILKYKI